MQADQNNVALGAVRIVQHAQDFHVHGLGLNTLETR